MVTMVTTHLSGEAMAGETCCFLTGVRFCCEAVGALLVDVDATGVIWGRADGGSRGLQYILVPTKSSKNSSLAMASSADIPMSYNTAWHDRAPTIKTIVTINGQ